MTILVSAYAESVALPRIAKRVRLCQYAGAFCAFCPDVESLPCVRAGGYQDCDTCTALGCPCMTKSTAERSAAYTKWKTWHDAANATTRERKARYGKRRWYNNNGWWDNSKAYSLGRTCAAPGCAEKITDKNKSGFCRRCAALRRGKEVTK